MLPTEKQLRNASEAFGAASHYAFSADLFSHETRKAEILVESMVNALKVGASQLGYELVERIPKPTARDGGRLDLPEGENA